MEPLMVLPAEQVGASTKLTTPVPALKLPELLQLPDSVITPLPATTEPPEAMVRLRTLLSEPFCSNSVPATLTSPHPRSVLPPPSATLPPSGTEISACARLRAAIPISKTTESTPRTRRCRGFRLVTFSPLDKTLDRANSAQSSNGAYLVILLEAQNYLRRFTLN